MTDVISSTDPATELFRLGRDEYNDRYGSLRQARNLALAFGVFGLLCGVVGVSYGAHQASARKYVPYVIAVDDLNNRALAAAPIKIDDWPPVLIRREVSKFVQSLRGITPDASVQIERIYDVYAYLGQSGLAHQKVTQYYQNEATNPKLRAVFETAAIDIETVTLQVGNTWNVEWLEETFERSTGKRSSLKRYRGSVVVTTTTDVDQEKLRRNPLGLVFVDLDFQEVPL